MGLLGCAISCGSTYVRLGDHRPYVFGADRKSRVGGGWAGGGGESRGSLALVFFVARWVKINDPKVGAVVFQRLNARIL